MWSLLLGTMGVKSLVQGLNAAATTGFEPFDPKSDAVTDWPLRFTQFNAGPHLEAILVIFGRRALIFFCLKALGKKNDTTLVHMRSGDHPGDANMSKKGTLLRRI